MRCHVRQDEQSVTKIVRLRSCSDVVHFASVHVHVIALVVDVVCFMLVLSARVVVYAVIIAFP